MLDPRIDADGRQGPRLPEGAVRFGMWLFLSSLAVFFLGCIFTFLWMLFSGPYAPGRGSIHAPSALWLSSAILIASSGTIHAALSSVRRERQQRFRTLLLVTLLLGVAFVGVQGPALVSLFRSAAAHELKPLAPAPGAGDASEYRRAASSSWSRAGQVYLCMLVLIAAHAAHVLGGLLPLAVVNIRAHQGRYDHEFHGGVEMCAMYWHFLDVVWLVMFAAFVWAG